MADSISLTTTSNTVSVGNTNYNIKSSLSGISNANANTISLKSVKASDYTYSLPTNQQNGNGITSTGKSGSVSQVISDMATSTNALAGSYGSLVSKTSELTNGAIKLPTIESGSTIANIMTGVNTATDILGTLTSNENGSRVQTNNVNVQPGAFKWVEFETQPKEFVDYDSVLIFAGKPIYADNKSTNYTFTPIGLCQSFQISTQLNVTTIQELRCEEQLIIPGKTSPITIGISRLCGIWPNLVNRLHGVQEDLKWNLGMQYTGARDLFGLYVMVLDTSRQNIVTQFYIERCAISSYSLSLTAGNMGILDNVSIIAGRIIDPTKIAATDTSTGNMTSTEGDVIVNENLDVEEDSENTSNNEVVEEEKDTQVSGQGEEKVESAQDGSGVADLEDIPTKEEAAKQEETKTQEEPQITTEPVGDNSIEEKKAQEQYEEQVAAEAVTKQQEITQAENAVTRATQYYSMVKSLKEDQIKTMEDRTASIINDPNSTKTCRVKVGDKVVATRAVAKKLGVESEFISALQERTRTYTANRQAEIAQAATQLSEAQAKLNSLKGS